MDGSLRWDLCYSEVYLLYRHMDPSLSDSITTGPAIKAVLNPRQMGPNKKFACSQHVTEIFGVGGRMTEPEVVLQNGPCRPQQILGKLTFGSMHVRNS